MTVLEWLAATVVWGLVGWALWTIRRDRRPLRMDGAWLDRQAAEDTKQGWLDGPRWRFPGEWRAHARRERFRRMAEARSQAARKGRCA